MSLNRREMLRLGAAGAGGLLLSGAASSQVLPSMLAPVTPPANPLALLPAAPASAAAPTYKAPRTPWGHPDLQGTWDYRTITPLERNRDRRRKGSRRRSPRRANG